MGAEECHHCHDDQTGGEVQGKRQKYRNSHVSLVCSICSYELSDMVKPRDKENVLF